MRECDEGLWNNSRKAWSKNLSSILITKAFEKAEKEGRPALISYTVIGDPSKEVSLEILKSISKSVDIAEFGISHNCPIGDGIAIQDSTFRALTNKIKFLDSFSVVKKFKETNKSTPIIFMLYYNLILQFGEDKFIEECKRCGVSGLIVVDLPYPINKDFADRCKENDISFISLLSPTTTKERAKAIIKNSHNMVYYISMLSTTGGVLKVDPKEIIKRYNEMRSLDKSKYYAIGFGITEKTISSLREAQGLVIGSMLCREIARSLDKNENPVTNLTKMTNSLKEKII